jgi:hypothetical protein
LLGERINTLTAASSVATFHRGEHRSYSCGLFYYIYNNQPCGLCSCWGVDMVCDEVDDGKVLLQQQQEPQEQQQQQQQ